MCETQKALQDVVKILKDAGWDRDSENGEGVGKEEVVKNDGVVEFSQPTELEKREFIQRIQKAAQKAGEIRAPREAQKALEEVARILHDAGWDQGERIHSGEDTRKP